MVVLAGAPAPLRLREESLENLMVRYQRADEDAAAELIRRVSPALLKYLAARIPLRRDLEDLLQECWLRVHSARHSYRPGEPVLPWVFAIVHHTWVDSYRRFRRVQARETAVEDLRERLQPATDPVGSSGLLFEQLLNELPDSQREVILLLKVSGMSLEEVARATSSTVGAVKQKAHRAYEKLRKVLAERGGAEAT
jgi:RNA polymerase sigma-70 factor (ECF subfamily)